MQVGTIQIERRRRIGEQEKYFAVAPWPQFTIIANDLVQYTPMPACLAIHKNGHIQIEVENGHASYKISQVQIFDPRGLTYELFSFTYSDPPHQLPSNGPIHLSF